MPNWTHNVLKITGDEPETIKQMVDFFEENTKPESEEDSRPVLTFQASVPRHKDLDISSPAHTDEDKKQAKINIKKYGFKDWYAWNRHNWGTKWNACNTEVELTENVLNYTFDTAWDAPREIVRALEHMKETILKDISIDWNCTHEDGNEEETLLEDKDE